MSAVTLGLPRAAEALHARPRHEPCFDDVAVDLHSRGKVIRADTPPRGCERAEGRDVLWMLWREGAPAVRAELVGMIDAVELEMFSGGRFRRRWRFLRDVAARRYADRVKARLVARGFRDRRGPARTAAWLD